MHHQGVARIPQCRFEPVRIAEIERQVILGGGVQHSRIDVVEAFRRLTVAFAGLRAEFPGPSAHRVCFQESIFAGAILLPYFQLALLFENANKDRRRGRHQLSRHLGDQQGRNRLGSLVVDIQHTRDATAERNGKKADGNCF